MNGLLNEVWTILIGVNLLVGEVYFALGWGPNGVSTRIRSYSINVESGKSSVSESTSESTGTLPIPNIYR